MVYQSVCSIHALVDSKKTNSKKTVKRPAVKRPAVKRPYLLKVFNAVEPHSTRVRWGGTPRYTEKYRYTVGYPE